MDNRDGHQRGRAGRIEPMTLEEIGLYFGVTRERIRQIEAKALKKLAAHMRAQGVKLEDFL